MEDTRESLSAYDFTRIWSTGAQTHWNSYPTEEGGDTFVLKNRIVQGTITLPLIEGKYPKLKLINCKLDQIYIKGNSVGTISVDDCDLESIIFTKCTIDSIAINNSLIKQVLFEDETNLNSIFIDEKSRGSVK